MTHRWQQRSEYENGQRDRKDETGKRARGNKKGERGRRGYEGNKIDPIVEENSGF